MQYTDAAALRAALVFHDSLLAEYTRRAAFGLAVIYLARKQPLVSLDVLENSFREALSVRQHLSVKEIPDHV